MSVISSLYNAFKCFLGGISMLTNSMLYLAPFTPRSSSSALSLSLPFLSSSLAVSLSLSPFLNETESLVANVENCDAREVDIRTYPTRER